jgi:hypothetical protein
MPLPIWPEPITPIFFIMTAIPPYQPNDALTSARFPKFVLNLSPHISRASESRGHWHLI